MATYIANYDNENDNIGGENHYPGNIDPLLSIGWRGPTPLPSITSNIFTHGIKPIFIRLNKKQHPPIFYLLTCQ